MTAKRGATWTPGSHAPSASSRIQAAPRIAVKHGRHQLSQGGVPRVGHQQLHVRGQQQALRATQPSSLSCMGDVGFRRTGLEHTPQADVGGDDNEPRGT